jgi:hypothetical protein
MSPEARLVEFAIELQTPPELPFTPRLEAVVVHGGLAYLSGNGDLRGSGASAATRRPRRSPPGRPRT